MELIDEEEEKKRECLGGKKDMKRR